MFTRVQNHQEHFTVMQGSLEITLDGKMTVLKAGAPDFIIPRRTVHSVKVVKGEPVTFRETADPPGMYKLE